MQRLASTIGEVCTSFANSLSAGEFIGSFEGPTVFHAFSRVHLGRGGAFPEPAPPKTISTQSHIPQRQCFVNTGFRQASSYEDSVRWWCRCPGRGRAGPHIRCVRDGMQTSIGGAAAKRVPRGRRVPQNWQQKLFHPPGDAEFAWDSRAARVAKASDGCVATSANRRGTAPTTTGRPPRDVRAGVPTPICESVTIMLDWNGGASEAPSLPSLRLAQKLLL